ncbi:tonB-system energizer ExbB [Ancylobacter radicis]|uniref:Biopolymer transport protein ExbB n=1 Tax=Ancylobacter radicis TaxID=2836179 RepID=A0ABS5RCQ2_9HYPH|nr:tonB-system energizer ExbB [Ancylobacter radicis]MBS9478877.1 tonB-system energizer ExbB [Ancylobacter radicis]
MLTSRTTAPFRRCVHALLALALCCGPILPALAQEGAPVAPTAQPAPSQPAPAATVPAVQPAPAPIAPAPAAAAPAPATGDALVPPMPGATGTAPDATAAPAPADAPSVAGAPAMPPVAGEDVSVAAQLPHDLSPWGMFMAADWVVKAVMIGLAFASVVTWTVWLAKSLELTFAKARLRRSLKGYLGSASLDAARAVRAAGPAAAMLKATDLELQRSGDLPAEGIKERVAISLGRIEVGAGRAITRGTGLLATIGATAPFVGLFGTVWGIMNSFIGISKAQTTNLAVVAPGIAEALLATAIGLVAAIPAVVIYNHFSRQVSGYRVLMGDASAEVLRLLSRDLDKRDAIARHSAEARQNDPRHTGHGSPVAAVRVRAAAE